MSNFKGDKRTKRDAPEGAIDEMPEEAFYEEQSDTDPCPLGPELFDAYGSYPAYCRCLDYVDRMINMDGCVRGHSC